MPQLGACPSGAVASVPHHHCLGMFGSRPRQGVPRAPTEASFLVPLHHLGSALVTADIAVGQWSTGATRITKFYTTPVVLKFRCRSHPRLCGAASSGLRQLVPLTPAITCLLAAKHDLFIHLVATHALSWKGCVDIAGIAQVFASPQRKGWSPNRSRTRPSWWSWQPVPLAPPEAQHLVTISHAACWVFFVVRVAGHVAAHVVNTQRSATPTGLSDRGSAGVLACL